MKLGLDVHGVIDAHWEVYRTIAATLIGAGHEVHIITGAHRKDVLEEVEGFPRTHFFSITDYHESIGTEIIYDSRGRPWIDVDLWNKTKAEYCAKESIDMMIDDSPIYGQYFTTPYSQVVPNQNGQKM